MELIKIKNIEILSGENKTFYDLEVEDDHSYTVSNNDIIVHNSQCETRNVTGVGYPQLSAIIKCAKIAHERNGFICSDGGCKSSGDIAKAFGAGADFVMLGTMLAAHEENTNKDILKNSPDYTVPVYGMASRLAMGKYGKDITAYRPVEGKVSYLPYKGKIYDTMIQIFGGLRSTCTYCNVSSLENLHKKIIFVKQNR